METRDITLSVLDNHVVGHREGEGRIVQVEKAVLSRNQGIAQKNRKRFKDAGVVVLNLLSSPGSGKTSLIVRTLSDLRSLRAAVIVGDLATDNDAQRIHKTKATSVQIQTSGVCHLEASMVAEAASHLALERLDIVFIENVGNLVCPAIYDLGEEARVVLFSTTEGEDKPLKYPKMFKSADLVLITKTDLAGATDFNLDTALHNVRLVAPTVKVIELSARTGQGLEQWYDALAERIKHVYA
jgi:hydrogenase nickel incorporation protein HypB